MTDRIAPDAAPVTDNAAAPPLHAPFLTSSFLTPSPAGPAMRTVVGDRAHIQRILDILAALARAEAAAGVIPATAGDAIAAAAQVEFLDIAVLCEAAHASGDAAAAVITALTAEVARRDAARIRVPEPAVTGTEKAEADAAREPIADEPTADAPGLVPSEPDLAEGGLSGTDTAGIEAPDTESSEDGRAGAAGSATAGAGAEAASDAVVSDELANEPSPVELPAAEPQLAEAAEPQLAETAEPPPAEAAVPASARYVGFGADDQDIADTAQVLELRAGIDALLADLNRAIEAFVALAGKHRRTPSIARTALRHAIPIPFGLKLAGYASALARSRERLRRLRKDALVLQFGGDAGTLAAFGEHGLKVADKLAALLDLPAPEAPWHGHGDRLAEVAAALAILAGSCGKIARDVALLMQAEVAEAFETASQAGDNPRLSQRRSPPAIAVAIAAATSAPNLLATIVAGQMQEHEGGLGGARTQALPALLLTTSGALDAVASLATGLGLDAERMRGNIEMSHGLVLAEAAEVVLGTRLPAGEAKTLVDDACRKAAAEKRHLVDILGENDRVTANLTPGELARLFELLTYQGVSQSLIDRIVAAVAARGAKRV